jgi:hypothetical protein
MKCSICAEPHSGMQTVVFHKESNSSTGYLVLDDQVLFDTTKIAKFLYFCASRGVKVKNSDMIDLCENCLRSARVGMN